MKKRRSMKKDAIETLISISPRDLVTIHGAARLPLDDVHDKLIQEGLAPDRSAASPKDKLWDIFSCALDAGVGSYVIDYVKEVTLDEGAASAQMKLHELMDEAAALDWVTLSARQSLSSLRNRLHSGGVDLLDVLGLTARVGVLLEVAGTLRSALVARIGPLPCPGDAPRGELGQAAALEGAYWDLRRAQHCLEAAHWLTGATAGEGFLQDYPTIERWRAAVAPRRSASFLAELLEACASSGVGDMPYPMPSPGAALSALLLEGPAEGPALRAKAALLGYYLVDGTVRGMVPSLAESLRSLAVRLGGRAGDASVWAAKALLDRAAHAGGDKDGAKALARLAAEQLSQAALDGPVPFSLITALNRCGFPQEAAALCRASTAQRHDGGPSLEEARTALLARLEGATMAEAAGGVTEHCGKLSGAAQEEAAGALIGDMLDWALRAGRVERLFELPWGPESLEERALVRALRARAGQSDAHAMLPGLYFAMRGRVEEARAERAPAAAGGEGSGDAALLVRQAASTHAAALRAARRAARGADAEAGAAPATPTSILKGGGWGPAGTVGRTAAKTGEEVPSVVSRASLLFSRTQATGPGQARGMDVDSQMGGAPRSPIDHGLSPLLPASLTARFLRS